MDGSCTPQQGKKNCISYLVTAVKRLLSACSVANNTAIVTRLLPLLLVRFEPRSPRGYIVLLHANPPHTRIDAIYL